MQPVTPTRVLSEIVVPVLDEMTQPGEVSSVRVFQRGEHDVAVEVDFKGETFSCWLIQPGIKDPVPPLGSFASDLQDFIAESTAAWGELRVYPERWDG